MHTEHDFIDILRSYMEKQLEQAKKGKLNDMISFIKKEL